MSDVSRILAAAAGVDPASAKAAAEAIRRAAAIRNRVRTIARRREALVKKHARELTKLTASLASVRGQCEHVWRKYHDPSGNGDSHHECVICGETK